MEKCVDGCSQSHLKIIKNSIDNSHKRILIFEDDIHFYEDGVTPCMDKIESALDELSNISEWDILYLGGSLLDNEITMMNKHLIKVQGMNTSHAYIINHTAFDKILNTYHYAYPMDILLSVSLNPKFSVYPVAVTQRGGDVSDIGGHDSFGPSGFINSYLKPIKKSSFTVLHACFEKPIHILPPPFLQCKFYCRRNWLQPQPPRWLNRRYTTSKDILKYLMQLKTFHETEKVVTKGFFLSIYI